MKTYTIEYIVTGGKRTDYVSGVAASNIVEAMDAFEALTHSGSKSFHYETRYAITKIIEE